MYGSYEDEYRNTEGRDLEVSVDRVLKDDDAKKKARRFGGRTLAIGAVIVVLIAATAGVAVWLRQNNQETIPSDMTSAPIVLSTLRQRNTVDDCWMALYDSVYDMTNYNHPGPQALVAAYCGSDATAEYGTVHPEVYMRTIEHLYVGVYESIEDGNHPIGKCDYFDVYRALFVY
jgi:cytochrome b involved in lipid metabolism